MLIFFYVYYAVFFRDFTDDSAGVSRRQTVRWNILCNNRASPDDRTFPDGNPTANGDVCGNPTIIADGDGFCIFEVGYLSRRWVIKGVSFLITQGMNCRHWIQDKLVPKLYLQESYVSASV